MEKSGRKIGMSNSTFFFLCQNAWTIYNLPRWWLGMVWYPLLCILPISFSNFMALPMSPSNFILPVMKAVVGFNLPANIFWKSLSFILKVTSGADGASPVPQAPAPFFRSTYHFPASEPLKKVSKVSHYKYLLRVSKWRQQGHANR